MDEEEMNMRQNFGSSDDPDGALPPQVTAVPRHAPGVNLGIGGRRGNNRWVSRFYAAGTGNRRGGGRICHPGDDPRGDGEDTTLRTESATGDGVPGANECPRLGLDDDDL